MNRRADQVLTSEGANIYLSVPHAPKRVHNLNEREQKQAVKNALRYFEPKLQAELKSEFSQGFIDQS